MAQGFFDRNKKKSLLAALLLLLPERKAPVLLLLVVLLATTAFVAPTSWIGAKIGAIRMGRHSFGGLARAFKEARERQRSVLASGTGAAGGRFWGSIFGAPKFVETPNSVDLIKASREELGAPRSVAGIVNPTEKEAQGAGGIMLGSSDLGGERAQAARQLAEGGIKEVGAGGGAPGGAWAMADFFRGLGGAVDAHSGAILSGGLSTALTPAAPRGRPGGAPSGRLSPSRSRGVETRAMKGQANASALTGSRALTQLAQGNALALLGTKYCKSPGCPREYSAVQTGANYDGTNVGAGLITADDPDSIGRGLDSGAVELPKPNDLAADENSSNVNTCMELLQKCQADKQPLIEHQAQLQTQLNSWEQQMGGACGNPCNCGPCNDLKGKISNLCGGDLASTMAAIDKPCDLPSYCAALGVTPASIGGSGGRNLCRSDTGKCGCSSFMCDTKCFFGS